MPEGAGPGWAAQERVKIDLLPALLAAFPGIVEHLDSPFAMVQVRVPPSELRGVATWLKNQGFNMLVDIGGVDYLGHPDCPPGGRFEAVYHLMALPQLWRLRIRVVVPEAAPELPSLADLWRSAAPAECELYDQFGLRFAGHPDLRRVLNPDDWEGHPLRKDYPLRGARALIPLMPAESNRFFPFKDEPEGGDR